MANDLEKADQLLQNYVEMTKEDTDKLAKFFSILIQIDQRERKKNARNKYF